MPLKDSVYSGDDVRTENISGNGVVIYPGCRIHGEDTFIHDRAVIGSEGPATIENCQIGKDVALKGGFFKESVFLDGVSMGFGSHVREGTICEEESSVAHTVGLKQTILFPYVTLGSLINFCDCFMAGGTSRKNHSEVGSSYIHFNYTPNQDKATASLLGDVPRGVMLKEDPIFLGGQGGLVGPCRLSYGTVIAAGTIQRKDEVRPNRLIIGGNVKAANLPMGRTINQNVKRIVNSNINYIANLFALKSYYIHIRSLFISENFPDRLVNGLINKVESAIKERIKRLNGFRENNLDSKNEFITKWEDVADRLVAFHADIQNSQIGEQEKNNFITSIEKKIAEFGKRYLTVIHSLNQHEADMGTKWLQEIVDTVNISILQNLLSYR